MVSMAPSVTGEPDAADELLLPDDELPHAANVVPRQMTLATAATARLVPRRINAPILRSV